MVWAIPAAMAVGSMIQQQDQNQRVDRANAASARAAAAQTQFSPWTKMGKGEYQHQQGGSTLGAGIQGGAQGAAFAQAYDAAQSQKALAESQAAMNNAQANQFYTQQMKQPYNSTPAWVLNRQTA